uniref:Uncharacterized protein n=1 Tax=Anguilla anguilla TaxID=7936 RepID=A0A0E9WPS5_ANGAN
MFASHIWVTCSANHGRFIKHSHMPGPMPSIITQVRLECEKSQVLHLSK